MVLDFLGSHGPPTRVREASIGQTEWEDVLLRVAITMKQTMAVGDRRKHLFKKYTHCFTGMEAVDWMLEHMEAKSIQEAVVKGVALMERQYIEKVEKEVTFEYSKKRFYRFTPTIPDVLHDQRIVDPAQSLAAAAVDVPLSAAARRRAMAALIGAFVADAASTSLNGVRHPEKDIPNLLRSDFDPAFCGLFETACEIYSSASSKRFTDHRMESSTGFEARVVLQSMAGRGDVHGPTVAKDLYWGFKTNPRLLSSTSRAFIKKIQSGKSFPHCAVRCKSIDILSVIPILVALYAGSDVLFSKVDAFVRVLYVGSAVRDAALVAAFILEQVILGASVLEALRMSIRTERLSVKQRKVIFKAFTKSQLPTYQAIQKFGNKGALPTGFCGVLQPLFVLNDYSTAVRENIIGGGRTCRRAMFLGACFAAQGGLESIPDAWILKTPYFDFIQADSMAILRRRDLHSLHWRADGDSTPYIDYSPTNDIDLTASSSSVSSLLRMGSLINRCTSKSCDSSASTPRSCASNYSYGSVASTASSGRSLIDLGEMSKYYTNKSNSDQLVTDMTNFYQQQQHPQLPQRQATMSHRKASANDLLLGGTMLKSDIFQSRRSSMEHVQPRLSLHAVL